MRRPSLRVQRANAGAPACAGDLSAAVTAARNNLAVSSASASASHPSLPEINTGTSAAAGQSDNNQVSGSSAVVRSDGVPSSPKRARTQTEVNPAAELVVNFRGSPLPERRGWNLRLLFRRQLPPRIGDPRAGPMAEDEAPGVGAGLQTGLRK